jgi:hypothetical protein
MREMATAESLGGESAVIAGAGTALAYTGGAIIVAAIVYTAITVC